MAKDEKLKALESAITQIEKDFGKEAIMKLGEKSPRMMVEVIPTGALPLDVAIGVGGVPRGRVVEIFGPESGGKSTLAMIIAAQAQKLGGISAYIDAEHAFDPTYAKNLGLDVENLYISQPDSGEQALEITERLVRSGAVDVIVIDSVAALVPKAEIEGEMGQASIGLQARLMSHALRKLTSCISKSKAVVIFINQIRHKIGIMFGNPETTPGGLALKFYSSIRLDIRSIEKIKRGDEIIGNRVRVKVVKNKVAPPFRQAEFEIIFGLGIPREGFLIDMGLDNQVLEKTGSWIIFKGEKIAQGYDQAKIYLKENPAICDELEAAIKAVVFPSSIAKEEAKEEKSKEEKQGKENPKKHK
ncbi:MAG: recombinase RecA [Elusimicrobia bacterium]|nr:recombinase RecA [Elusimicrobiota bacterium]MBU2615344.1 recombinase RecA [Elusimicrobiota bacterium]